jgi:hypothetical protein
MAPSHPEHAIDRDDHGDGFGGDNGDDVYAHDPVDTMDDVTDLPLAAPLASAPDDAALAAAMRVETATANAATSRDRTGRAAPAPMGA